MTGGGQSLALRADDPVWGWGGNSDWEPVATAPGGGTSSTTPFQATGLNRVRDLATGTDHGPALRADGTVWCWGWDIKQFAPEPPSQMAQFSDDLAIAMGITTKLAVKADGTV